MPIFADRTGPTLGELAEVILEEVERDMGQEASVPWLTDRILVHFIDSYVNNIRVVAR